MQIDTSLSLQESLEGMTDEQLLAAYADGEIGAFEILEKRYHNELFSYLRRYLDDPEGALDVLQQVFLKLHVKCGEFDRTKKVRPWLYRIATNQAIDWQRKNRRHHYVSLDTNNSPDEEGSTQLRNLIVGNEQSGEILMDIEERKDAVRRAMARIPELMAESLHLIYWENLKYREAAAVAGAPDGTIKSRCNTGLRKIEELLQEYRRNS